MVIALFATRHVFAQSVPSLSGVATNIEISESDAKVGDILSVSAAGLKRSAVAYDTNIYGVIVEAPVISIEPKTDKTKSVASSGVGMVRVSGANGNIEVGDFITSSSTPGLGQKATENGYVLGKATASFNGQGESLIGVSIEIGFKQVGANAQPKGFLQSIVGDSSKLRLMLAAILGVVILLGSVVAFIRLVNSGVIAMGRNPLAKAQIMKGMLISGSVVVFIMILGLGGAVALIMLGK